MQSIALFVTITNEIYRHTNCLFKGHNHTQVAKRNIQWMVVTGYLNYVCTVTICNKRRIL